MFRPDEVAELLGISKRTIYRYHGEGKINGIKVAGQTLRFTRSAIISILKESE
jgi:excisionase family DNA binding protein